MSASYTAPEGAPPAAVEQEQLAPVLVAFAGPAPQARTTVAFRLFLAIPQFIVLWALAIAAYVITIIGWFAALFTGRLPAFAAEFLTGFLRWQTRVFGYTILLTDEYPPFTLEDADYPIRVAVRPGRLNRLAVLFRFFLLIPAWIVLAVLAYGALTLVQFVSWLVVLISGQMPDTLYQALAAVLRYQARVYGFACMLTSAYPGGLYGDLMTVPGGVRGAQTADGYGAATAEAAMAPWLLVLSAGTKRLVTGFVILGALLMAGQTVLEAVATRSVVTAAEARYQLQTDTVPVSDALNDYPANAQACRTSLPCITSLDRRVAATLDTIASSSGLQQAVDQMNQDYINLGNTLSGS